MTQEEDSAACSLPLPWEPHDRQETEPGSGMGDETDQQPVNPQTRSEACPPRDHRWTQQVPRTVQLCPAQTINLQTREINKSGATK